MSTILRDLSRPALIGAIEENLCATWALVGKTPLAECEVGPELMRLISGVPSPVCNGVYRARFAAADADARIRDALLPFRSRKLPMIWWAGPSSRPSCMGPRLAAHGLVHADESPGMALDLSTLDRGAPPPPGLAVETVSTTAALERWRQVFQAGFEMPEPVARFFFDALLSLGLGARLPVRHLLGSLRGEPAACCSMFLLAGVAGIYNVATVPDSRRRGCASAMVAALLRQARGEGYRVAILHSTEAGLPVYRRLGFRAYCAIDQYTLGDA